MKELREGDYVVFVWDLYEEDKSRRSLFYKKLSGYRTRRYGQVVPRKRGRPEKVTRL